MDLTRVYKKSSHVIQILDTWDLDKLNLFAKSLSNNPNLSLVRHMHARTACPLVIASSLAHTFHVLQFGLSCLTIEYTVTFTCWTQIVIESFTCTIIGKAGVELKFNIIAFKLIY